MSTWKQTGEWFGEVDKNGMKKFPAICTGCGKGGLLRRQQLREGNQGCRKCSLKNYPRGFTDRDPKFETLHKRAWCSHLHSCGKRSISNHLSFEQWFELVSQDCHYCGCESSNITQHSNGKLKFFHNGVDRVDNSLGYTMENSVACCKTCNLAKRGVSKAEFISWIRSVFQHIGKT